MKTADKKILLNTFYIIIVILTVLRIGYFVRMPYYAIGDSGYDDCYLLRLADSILVGKWLGHYCMTTLIKGISFPLFVVASNVIGVSYSVLLAAFYIFSACVFCFALSKLANNKFVIGIVYLFLIYNPVGFTADITQRLYRNSLIYPSVLLVFACILIVYIYRKESIGKQLVWLIALGFSFAFFYYIREDSVWLLPMFIMSLVIIAVWFLFFDKLKDKKYKIKRILCLLVPIVVFMTLSGVYSGLNYKYYGVWEKNDRSGSNFATLTGNMIKVKDESGVSDIYWISKDTLERIIDCCPSLSKDKDMIMEVYRGWSGEGDEGNVKGDWAVWAIRVAFEQLGYYENAKKIDAFCEQVNNELLQAVEDGKLQFDDAFHYSTQSRGIYLEEIPGFISDTIKNIWHVTTFRDAYAALVESSGHPDNVEFMESITNVGTIENTVSKTNITGWIIRKDDYENTYITLETGSGEIISYVNLYQREDVYNVHQEYESALYSGFSLELDVSADTSSMCFAIYRDGQLVTKVPVVNYEDEHVILHIEQKGIITDIDLSRNYSDHVVRIFNILISIGRAIATVVFPIALVMFIYLVVVFCRNRTWDNFEAFIIPLGLLLSIFILEFGVTIFNSWLNAIWFYSTGVIPLAQSFEILCLVYGIKSVKKKHECLEN